MSDIMEELFASLNARRRPEDVAALIARQLDERLSVKERQKLNKAARGSLKNQWFSYTSMSQDFARPCGAAAQMQTASILFQQSLAEYSEADDPRTIERFIRVVSPSIGKTPGESDFEAHRLSHAARRARGITMSRRQYNKRFRHLARLEAKQHKIEREWKKHTFTKIGKSALASRLSRDDFSRDENSACFIAYYTARCNLRSEFTISGQQKPFDDIAQMLLERCERNGEKTHWFAIAHVFADARVLRHVGDEQKGFLLAQWFTLLQEIAQLLREVWSYSDINRATMIVRRGNDSSTWNNTANAWNKARDGWIAFLHALGAEEVLDAMCVGKVLGLMAADVAYWHRVTGGGLHPDTFVWNELPLPWEVLSGEASCSRAQVEDVCRKHKVDAVKGGWTAPKVARAVAFRATPELVHGVTVASPYLAKVLRDAGVFSGKPKAHNLFSQTASLN